MKKQIALSIAIASLFSVGTAFAQNDSGNDKTPDSNAGQSDNAILFGMLDTDNDGNLTEDELANMPEAVAKLAYQQMDFDGNGNVSQLEYTTAAQAQAIRTFGALDANGDGSLNTDEITSDAAQQNGQMSDARMSYYEQVTEEMDQDDDGNVSRSEWIEAFVPEAADNDASKMNKKNKG